MPHLQHIHSWEIVEYLKRACQGKQLQNNEMPLVYRNLTEIASSLICSTLFSTLFSTLTIQQKLFYVSIENTYNLTATC